MKTPFDEKEHLTQFYDDIEQGDITNQRRGSFRKLGNVLLGSCILITLLIFYPSQQKTCVTSYVFETLTSFGLDQFNPPPPTVLVFELQTPLTLESDSLNTSVAVFDNVIFIDQLSFDYTAPASFNFTTAILNLGFVTGGTQEPIVAELFLDEYPLWRTSTPNPLGLAAESVTTKNITEYLTLFKSDRQFSISIVDGAITGDVSISLEAIFINEDLPAGNSSASIHVRQLLDSVAPIDIKSVFTEGKLSGRGADTIIPISNQGQPFNLPVDTLKVQVAQIPSNSTYAKLEIFLSASEDEVEYYNDDISTLPSRDAPPGPLRQFNIFIDGVYISTISPNPVLFTANKIVSGATNLIDLGHVYSPVAAPGAFIPLAYEVDLTPVLPLLWSGASILEIDPVSPVNVQTPEHSRPIPNPGEAITSPIKSSWAVSGNLLAWESDKVIEAVGAIGEVDTNSTEFAIYTGPPSGFFINEITSYKVKTGLTSSLNLTFIDGSVYNFSAIFNNTIESAAIKTTKKVDATTKLSFESSNKLEYKIDSVDYGSNVISSSLKESYPFTYNFVDSSKAPVWGPPIASDSLTIRYGISVKEKLNGDTIHKYSSEQDAYIDNLGFSSTFKFKEEYLGLPYSRDVTVTNGKII